MTLKREDGSTIEVGSAIEGMQSDMRELDGRVNRMGVEIKEVGALSAALAGLHPQPENANSRADFAMAMGSYEGKQALAVGGFYRPDKRTMLSIGASTTSSKHMMNMVSALRWTGCRKQSAGRRKRPKLLALSRKH